MTKFGTTAKLVLQEEESNGKAFRILNIMDEYTRESLCIRVARSITSEDVIKELAELFILKGILDHIRSDNESEFTAKAIRKWLTDLAYRKLLS